MFSSLPFEIQYEVFLYLDLKSSFSAMQCCKLWNSILQLNSQWKHRFLRDFAVFQKTTCLPTDQDTDSDEELDSQEPTTRENTDPVLPISSNYLLLEEETDIENRNAESDTLISNSLETRINEDEDEEDNIDHLEEENFIHFSGRSTNYSLRLPGSAQSNDVLHHQLCSRTMRKNEPDFSSVHTKIHLKYGEHLSKNDSHNKQPKPIDWKFIYKEFFSSINVTDIWQAEYGVHGEETIQVVQEGYFIHAVKITGDPNVPAGKPTWNIVLFRDRMHGKGQIHLADTGYQNPRWEPAKMTITDRNNFFIYWCFTLPSFNLGFPFPRRHTVTMHFQRKHLL